MIAERLADAAGLAFWFLCYGVAAWHARRRASALRPVVVFGTCGHVGVRLGRRAILVFQHLIKLPISIRIAPVSVANEPVDGNVPPAAGHGTFLGDRLLKCVTS